jgi:uncharacterized protein YjeT (DUF2065 family)
MKQLKKTKDLTVERAKNVLAIIGLATLMVGAGIVALIKSKFKKEK